MRLRAKLTFVALAGAGMLAFTATAASARIVCNDRGACWHVQAEYNYPPSVHLTIHPDNWHWGAGQHFAWREHEGRGYWRGGSWHVF
jgi:hypothetical protein